MSGSKKLATVVQIDPEGAMFREMVDGYVASMRSRGLAESTIYGRRLMIRRFSDYTGEYPWKWRPADVAEYSSSLLSGTEPLAQSTLRGYQLEIKDFCAFLVDSNYDWVERCQELFGTFPTQICNPWNTFEHLQQFEAKPTRRALTYDEIEHFFAVADELVARGEGAGRKMTLPAHRDSQLFKTMYAFGLRRQEAVMMDLADLRTNPHKPEWGSYGRMHVRYGKSSKGSPPKRRTVLALPEFEWAVEGLRNWVEKIRPALAKEGVEALWLTERRQRMTARILNKRFAMIRDAAGLDSAHTPHSLRHSYVTHLIELGYPERFVQEQVGHEYASTTAIYTSVSDDYKNRVLAQALERVMGRA